MDHQIDTDLRAIHSRITDGEDTIELHSADIAAIIGHIQALTKRLQVCEELLAFHCGFDINDMREVAAEIRNGSVDEDSHELGTGNEGHINGIVKINEDHVPDAGNMIVPGD